MTSEEFWKDDPKLFSSYQKAYINKVKKENEIRNTNDWLQGLYIYDGFKKCLNEFGVGLSGKKIANPETYPKEPYDLFGNKEERKEQEKEMKRKQSQNNLNYWATIKK